MRVQLQKLYVTIGRKCHSHEARPSSCYKRRRDERQTMKKINPTYQTTETLTKKNNNRGTALDWSVEQLQERGEGRRGTYTR